MAVDIQPTGTSLLVVLGAIAFFVMVIYTGGGWLTLVLLGLIIGAILFAIWAAGKRLARWGAGG